jgi:hypothetical protein
MSGINTPR